MKGSRTIRVDTLARVVGEGALVIRLRGGKPKEVKLRIYEPPRFFEAFLRGRSLHEVPDITARICGICPVAYQMSSCRAMEDALGIAVSPEIGRLRRLLYCGEWIESHGLHVFLLHAPDFLGYPDAITMARDHGDVVRRGLAVKKTGNAIVTAVGGREIHPVNVRVGGFYRAPARSELERLRPEIDAARASMREALRWMASFRFPEFEREVELVALRHPSEYAILEGPIASSGGLDTDAREFDRHFVEEHVAHSNALHATLVGRGAYLCGPLARFNLNFDELAAGARAAAAEIGLAPPVRNPFRSLLVRGVEILHALEEAARHVEEYVPPDPPWVEAPIRPGVGCGATEAPRGLLWHRYRVDENGLVAEAKIVPPTSQNQKSIEDDLFALAPRLLEGSREEATLLAEQAVRNHDPCISCATHFLRLTIEDEEASTP